MMSIQLILAVVVVAAVCGSDESLQTETYDDNFYNQHQGHRGKRGNGYCTNGGCREGYNYYDNRGYCKYGSRSYKYDCNSYTGCCLPRNPYSRLHYYCTSHNGCPKNYYFYNNKGYYYYNRKHYYNCQLYNGCCIRAK
ncbi:Hypothetical predicted protein, partial [Mytilus galloprovincialis]